MLTTRGDWIRADQIVRVKVTNTYGYSNPLSYRVAAVTREFSGSWSEDGSGGVSPDEGTLIEVRTEEQANEAAAVVVRGLADCADMAALLDFTQGRVTLTPVSRTKPDEKVATTATTD